MLNKDYPSGQPGHGIPYPIVFVIDAKGVITHRFSNIPYTTRTEIDSILNAIR